MPERGKGFDDALETEEDDDARGDPKEVLDAEAPGGVRVEYFDKPQSEAAYHFSKEKMKTEKAKLVRDGHVIEVEVKTKKSYEFGGRVEGKAGFEFAECSGTIIDVVAQDRYRIQW